MSLKSNQCPSLFCSRAYQKYFERLDVIGAYSDDSLYSSFHSLLQFKLYLKRSLKESSRAGAFTVHACLNPSRPDFGLMLGQNWVNSMFSLFVLQSHRPRMMFTNSALGRRLL